MFLTSLNLTTDIVQRERICDQLDKIEKQILLETNAEYEEEYMRLIGEDTKLFDEEKNRLRKLISLITNRREYLEERKNKHKKITGSLVELTTLLGEDKLTTFKKRLKIIEKYEENKIRQENLIKDMKSLDIKISEASRSVKANMRLNDILENKMMTLISKTLEKLNLYALIDKKDQIQKKYESLEYAVNLARDNLKSAKELKDNEMILECDNMLSEIALEHSKYKEEINILKLIDIYDKPVSDYDELLKKRNAINEILKNIPESKLYEEINEELSKEYNTIKLEKQDIKNYDNLKLERERKNKLLYEIEEENNSKEFKAVLDDLIKSENKYREEQIRRARKLESKEREKKILEEQKIEAARVKRQKLIEEARLKDQMERAEKLKELQDKTVIQKKTYETSSEEINNPLKNKSLDDLMTNNNIHSDFDTDELFENTKIVPNKLNKEMFSLPKEDSLYQKVTKEEEIKAKEEKNIREKEILPPVWNEPVKEETLKEDKEMVLDLFKEEDTKDKIELKEDVKKKEGTNTKSDNASIYDLLENNKNIIWKSTETKETTNDIPVIGNKNLKPEVIENKKVNMSFPELTSKEGEVLWKETL